MVSARGVYDSVNNVFTKTVQKSKHMMRVMSGWGIDQSILNELPEDCKIVVNDTESGTSVWCTKETYLSKGVKRSFGHGVQYILPEKYFCHAQSP